MNWSAGGDDTCFGGGAVAGRGGPEDAPALGTAMAVTGSRPTWWIPPSLQTREAGAGRKVRPSWFLEGSDPLAKPAISNTESCTRDPAQSSDIPACRNSGSVSRSSARITGPTRRRSISQRREPGSQTPPARCMTCASSRGQRIATMRPNSANSTGPIRAGRGGGGERIISGSDNLPSPPWIAPDMKLTFAAIAATLAIAPACAQPYTYVPNERDRAELRACERSAGPTTTAEDCLLPVVTRVVAGMQYPRGQDWPDDPQMAALSRIALTVCGLPPGASPRHVPTPPPMQCFRTEANKINAAIVFALRDVLLASGVWK